MERDDDAKKTIAFLKTLEDQYLNAVHRASFKNGEAIKARVQTCGCFYCEKIFSSEELTEDNFLPERDGGTTVMCPYCGIDSVIHEDAGFPINEKLLRNMNKRFFRRGPSGEA